MLFVILKASQRASTVWCSPILNSLLNAVSNSQKDGPVKL